jgi:hypothetical protein
MKTYPPGTVFEPGPSWVWHPIKTIPKNGYVLLWIPSTKMAWPGHFSDGRVYSNAHGLVNEQDHGRILEATHWMLMPNQPEATLAQGK